MPNFTMRMDEELKRRMQAHEEINWSHVIRESVRSKLDDLERMDELTASSQLTEEDVEELAAKITAAAAESAREDLDNIDPETIETALENRELRTESTPTGGADTERAETGH